MNDMVFKKILVVANPYAGNGRVISIHSEYLSFLEEHDIPYFSYLTISSSNEHNIRTLIEVEGCDMVSVIGGDGTLNIVLNSIPNLNIPLHLIPAGTGDDFAKMLYPSGMNTKRSFKLIHQFGMQTVDVWRCNGKRFCLGFGAGFDGRVAQYASKNQNIFSTRFKYWYNVLRLLFSYSGHKLTINGKETECFMVSLANGKYIGGSFKIAPQASVSDQLMDQVRIADVPLLRRLYYLPFIQFGKHLKLPVVQYSKVDSVTIASDHGIPAHIDGEPLYDKSYHIAFDGIVNFLA